MPDQKKKSNKRRKCGGESKTDLRRAGNNLLYMVPAVRALPQTEEKEPCGDLEDNTVQNANANEPIL